MIRRVSLAGQLLILQLGIVLVVLIAASAVSVAQAQASFREVQGRRVLSVAERAAASDIVRENLADPAWRNPIAAVVDGYRDESVADYAMVAGVDRRVLASTDPSQIGRLLDLHGSNVLQGRAWEGVVTEDGVRSVAAHAPVLDGKGRTVGFVVVGANTPGVWDSLQAAVPNLLTYLGVASVLGVAGSLLLARRVKRQTLGLEPQAITRLAEHRDTMLHGIREGVVGLDPRGRVTLVNLDAIGHAPDGWVAVQIGHENGHARVVVRDSGPGVAPELAEEVFEHGFTTKAAADGQRGIGLALIRMVCARRGGQVSVRNDNGAVFTPTYRCPRGRRDDRHPGRRRRLHGGQDPRRVRRAHPGVQSRQGRPHRRGRPPSRA